VYVIPAVLIEANRMLTNKIINLRVPQIREISESD
jgi:hypothetical protein